MDYVFARHGVDAMLERGEIDFMVLSHWHLDHFWGIESTLKHNPRLRLYAPGTWRPEDRVLLKEKGDMRVEDHEGRSISICRNDVPHEGELILTEPEGDAGEGLYRLLPGVALRMFDASMLLQVRDENVLYVNVADKGIVTVTGCGHPGIMNLLGFARDNLAAPGLYGCYGGLHLSIFDTWKPEFEQHHRRRQCARDGEDGVQSLHRLDVGGEGGRSRRADRQGHRRLLDLSEAIGAGEGQPCVSRQWR
jgi:7,8-dihydropterin-6-yl-methyl-4-(beta-D-ribofuranosyl)aminobenzene 5'-phosphate synthase